MSLATFLTDVRAQIATGLACDVVDGQVDGPLELGPGRRLACVFPDDTEEVEGDVYHEVLRVVVRVFLPALEEFQPGVPIPTADLVQARTDLIAALKPHQTSEFGVWYFRLTASEFFPREQYVQTRVVAWQQAEFTAGAQA